MGGCLHVTEREEGEEHPGLVDQARIDTLSIGDGCRKHVFCGKHYSLWITYCHDIRQYLLLSKWKKSERTSGPTGIADGTNPLQIKLLFSFLWSGFTRFLGSFCFQLVHREEVKANRSCPLVEQLPFRSGQRVHRDDYSQRRTERGNFEKRGKMILRCHNDR